MCRGEEWSQAGCWGRADVGMRGLVMYRGVVDGFFFQAEDGIRDAQESRGLGDVYKRQHQRPTCRRQRSIQPRSSSLSQRERVRELSLIHI